MIAPAAALINLLGYITGSALYLMLLVMVLSRPRTSSTTGLDSKPDRLPLLTALLGLAWNSGALTVIGYKSLVIGHWAAQSRLSLLNAAAFTALGFLPAVVVHSVLRTGEDLKERPAALLMIILAYVLGTIAGILHLYQALVYGIAPSRWALHTLTIGFAGLIVILLLYTRRGRTEPSTQAHWQRAVWVAALAVFAVSALHLTKHEGREFSWWVELIGHHASLPLALAILYQDYRFALADIFLKRALSLLLLVALAFGLYLEVAAPLIGRHSSGQKVDSIEVGLLLGLWVVTALVYPKLRRAVDRFVDSIVLRRADYEAVRSDIAQRITICESPEDILDEACRRLSDALTTREVRWAMVERNDREEGNRSSSGPLLPLVRRRKGARRLKQSVPRAAAATDFGEWSPENSHDTGWQHPQRTLATVLVPATDQPQYHLFIGEMVGGRQLLSDDLALLESIALMAARRIDAVRVVHERCIRDLHEEEMRKLATEAELRALRAQINPHFLFNALTTIGYLIQASPDLAFQTLMRLTTLLRGVLRHSEGEFSTLGEEIELIESYLEIERARFEDRLRVMIDVPPNARGIRIPALLIQPLVENAIKHGVSPQRTGGEVVILARLSRSSENHTLADDTLQIWVRDTGAGASDVQLEQGRRRGVGLSNVEQRIRRHFGDAGVFSIRSAPGVGTTVELGLPVNLSSASINSARATGNSIEARRKQA